MLSADGLPTHLIVTRSGMRTRRRSTGPSGPASPRPSTLSYHQENLIRDCGMTLESPSFSARDGSTGKLLRTFEMVAASKPTSRLSSRSHFLCHSASPWGPWSAVWVVPLSSVKLIPHALTPGVRLMVFGVGFRRVAGEAPDRIPSLYPHQLRPEAGPKAISERTSYLQV